jgi:hypothetical protein
MFQDRLNNEIDACLREASMCSALHHHGLSGNVRQLVVERLLTPMLPEGFRIGTGKITDSEGNLSAETDVIIYDRRAVPPLMYDEKLGVFPIESVYYAIEVKTTLTVEEFESSIQKGIKLRSLRGSGLLPHSALFAFSSDLKVKKDSERFIERQKDILGPPPINVFCIAGREYGFLDGASWGLWQQSKEIEHSEITGFLVGVTNTLVGAVPTTRKTLPTGFYFFPRGGNSVKDG